MYLQNHRRRRRRSIVTTNARDARTSGARDIETEVRTVLMRALAQYHAHELKAIHANSSNLLLLLLLLVPNRNFRFTQR